MYLAEVVNQILAELEHPDFAKATARIPHVAGINFVLDHSRVLMRDYDLYAFDRSALVAASDLKTERQEGLEAIAEKVLETPRRLFMETNWADRQRAFSRVPTMPSVDVPVDYGQPVRVGICLDVHGGGRATLQTAWIHPLNTMRDLADDGFLAEIECPKKSRKTLKRLLTLNWSIFRIEIDVNRRSHLTKKEFIEECRAGNADFLPFLEAQKAISGTLGEKAIIDRAFALYRLNCICRYRVDPAAGDYLHEMAALARNEMEAMLDTFRSDLDGEIIFGIAMAALLELDDVDVRPAGKTSATGGKNSRARKRTRGKQGPERLGVVSLDIDKDIVSSHFRSSKTEGQVSFDAGGAARRSPVAHPVSGHLFRARNGKVVYRKPHWRGKDVRKRIAKVRRR
ncbi:hypothetical protein [Salipiger mucosus]|uniref:Uncharacterized protein n=1 Tax=Salipiger mucosus DSM 16094 TaxID=1123237 RepID=S9QWV5_9RHOB|nr:hypothetical protein [Salipiger mucosus]EPX84057.1 hypothetical protein Salmuc_01832 [Salipiger mucosus DSM 16094]